MLNLAARNKEVRNKALMSFCGLFPSILILDISQDINEVVLALPASREKTLDELIVCDDESTRKEILGQGICQMECKLRSRVLESINRFSERVALASGKDIEFESFHSDLLNSFSKITILKAS